MKGIFIIFLYRDDDMMIHYSVQKMMSWQFTKLLQGEDTMAVYEDHKKMFIESF